MSLFDHTSLFDVEALNPGFFERQLLPIVSLREKGRWVCPGQRNVSPRNIGLGE